MPDLTSDPAAEDATTTGPPTSDWFELFQPILGMEPYVLLIAQGDPDDLSFRVKAGGGIKNTDEIRTALILALSCMAPLSAEEIALLTDQQED
jgi:hypothetical protein